MYYKTAMHDVCRNRLVALVPRVVRNVDRLQQATIIRESQERKFFHVVPYQAILNIKTQTAIIKVHDTIVHCINFHYIDIYAVINWSHYHKHSNNISH